MKRFIFLTLFFSQLAFGGTLPKSAFVFDVYGEKIPVSELKNGNEIKIIDEDHKFQEAEVFNVSRNDRIISFEVVDYDDEEVLSEIKAQKSHRSISSPVNTRRLLLPMALLASSTLPTAEAGPWAAGLYAVVGTVASVGAGVVTTVTTGGNVAAGLAVTTTGIEFVKDTAGLVAIIPGA